MPRRYILASLILVLLASLWAAPIDDFRHAFMANQSDAAVLHQLITDFKDQPLSLEDHRLFQSLWNYVDPQAMQAHYDGLREQNPTNPEFIYLSIRMQETESQMRAARKLIQDYPAFYWGYRMVAVNLTELISSGEAGPYLKSPEYKKDLALIQQGLQLFGADPYLNTATFYAYKDSKDHQRAAAALDKVSDPETIGSNMRQIEEFLLKTGDLDMYTRLISTVMDDAVESGQISAAEAEMNTHYYIMDFLVKGEGIKALDKYIAENPSLKTDPDFSRIIAGLYMKHDRPESALDALQVYAASSAADYMYLKNSNDFTPLQSHPRWQTLLGQAKTSWDRTADLRRAKALQGRGFTPAPPWEMQDLKGKSYKLEDLKGKIIILDFWASWCSPCKMAMPALSRWIEEEMPQGVEVFSVNVMEREPQDGKDYFSAKDFKMTYLEGSPEISAAYGVTSIPHFTIIDQAGNIAWDVVGFSYSFEESLSFQIEALKQD